MLSFSCVRLTFIDSEDFNLLFVYLKMKKNTVDGTYSDYFAFLFRSYIF